ncbi:hypothetical protein [Undibacterium sp. TJN19]
MQELNAIELEIISGGMIVDRENLPSGVYLDKNGNPVDSRGFPLF